MLIELTPGEAGVIAGLTETWMKDLGQDKRGDIVDEACSSVRRKIAEAMGRGSAANKMRRVWGKIWRITLSFLFGVAITTVVHVVLTNHQVRKTAEAVCTVFGSDEAQCKDGIDDVLDMADQVTENNTNVKGE